MAPSASNSRSRRLRTMRSEPLRPVSRARSRLVAPGFSARIVRRRALSSGGAMVRAIYSPATGSGFFLALVADFFFADTAFASFLGAFLGAADLVSGLALASALGLA